MMNNCVQKHGSKLTHYWDGESGALCSSLTPPFHHSLKGTLDRAQKCFIWQKQSHLQLQVLKTQPPESKPCLPQAWGQGNLPVLTLLLGNSTEGLVFWPIPRAPQPCCWPSPPAQGYINPHTLTNPQECLSAWSGWVSAVPAVPSSSQAGQDYIRNVGNLQETALNRAVM